MLAAFINDLIGDLRFWHPVIVIGVLALIVSCLLLNTWLGFLETRRDDCREVTAQLVEADRVAYGTRCYEFKLR